MLGPGFGMVWPLQPALCPMNTVPAPHERPEAPLFCDGLGERVVAADGATGELLQILRIRQALTAVPSFEFALRERAARLANFRHAYYARVRRIDRLQVPAPGLAIVSDHVEGTRLSDILRVAEERNLQLDANAALCLIRQLVPAVALLHENAREVAHGLISPERLIVTPHARLVIVEHVLAAAIEQLQFGRDRLWQEFRIAMPPSAGLPRFDHRADVTGIGLVALALLLGRPLRTEEFPHRLPALLNDVHERTDRGEEQRLSSPLRDWLARALQLDVRRAFASAPEALGALEEIVADDTMFVAAPVALETFLSRYIAALLEPTIAELQTPAAAPPVSAPVQAATRIPEAPPVSDATPDYDLYAELLGQPPPPATPAPPAPVFDRAPTAPVFDSAPMAPPVVAPEVRTQAPEPVQPVASAPPARDLTELISAFDLPATGGDSTESRGLYEPNESFSVPSGAELPASSPKTRRRLPMKAILAAIVVVALGIGGYYGMRFYNGAATPQPEMGTLIVQTKPAGIQVFVDGVDRGPTPARLSVTPGAHILELRGRGVPRVIPLTVAAGTQVSQYLEFANTPETGQLRVESQPAGAKVIVDGTDRGTAPLTITDLTPGEHEVVLQAQDASARHVVSVQAGGTASLVAPVVSAANSAGPVSGWLTVKAPFSLEIREEGRVIGTTDAERVMMAAGRHELELVNETLGFRVSRVVQVPPGKVATIPIDLPSGVVNLNAAPWAEVWIDGQRVGETPIGNLSVPIGPHEVIFRHPQFGEKRHAISVTLGGPVRLSVNMQ